MKISVNCKNLLVKIVIEVAHKYIIRKRQNTILYTELLLAPVIATFFFVIHFKLHFFIGFLIGIASIISFYVLFFWARIFRYLFSILFSIAWALGAVVLGLSFEKTANLPVWIFAALVFIISIWAHWNHFNFIKNSEFHEYE